jgi:phage terminase large subunit
LEVSAVIAENDLDDLFEKRIAEGVIKCVNGYQAIFVGLDDTQKLKSIRPIKGAITDIWVEEATETDSKSVKELYKRQRGGEADVPKRLTMSFNPILQSHWIFMEHFKMVGWADDQTEYMSDDLSILKSWYIHNRFLTSGDIEDLENEQDEYFREVYTFGNWGILGNVIFKNWRVEDLSQMRDQFTNYRHGGDFGFSNDPAAIVVTHYDKPHKTIYVYDELYERGLTNDILAVDTKEMVGADYIVWDSAEPKSIEELRRYGVNVGRADKGKDSVLHGIQWLQQQAIVIDKNCINARNEFMQYQWKEDRDGNAIRQPIDKNNHIIDALRYAYEKDALASWFFT